MRTPESVIIAELDAAGIRLLAVGDKLRVDAPAGVLTPELTAMLRASKTKLLSLISARQSSPAESILVTCRRHGVSLRIDEVTGELVVGRTGAGSNEQTQPWPSLMLAIEAHLEPVAALVRSGWGLKAGFPADATAA